MQSKLAAAVALRSSPIAVISLTRNPKAHCSSKKAGGVACREYARGVPWKDRVFDRRSAVRVARPTSALAMLSEQRVSRSTSSFRPVIPRTSGGSLMVRGERFFRDRETVRRVISRLPITDVPTEYVVMKPLETVGEVETPELVIFLVNP